MSEPENKSPPSNNMSSGGHPPPNALPPTQDQFNTVFAQLLSNLRRQDDVASVSEGTQNSDDEEASVEDEIVVVQTREERQARTSTLKALLESHKLICEAVLFHLRQK